MNNGIFSGFVPSISGFHFSNNEFPDVPLITIDIGLGKIPIGNARYGLCGGMSFAARDYFEFKVPIPPDRSTPSSGPLFDYLVQRLLESFNLPSYGPTKYMFLMNPSLPDHETWFSNLGLAPHGRAWVMINEEWPKIKANLDNGHPTPLALITIKSIDPSQIGHNHQVLAYGYKIDNTNLTIWVYDCNHPDKDNISISLSINNPQHTTVVNYSEHLGGDNRIWCFFCPNYNYISPLGRSNAPSINLKQVPYVITMTVGAAVQLVERAGLVPIVTGAINSTPNSRVFNQSPHGGTFVASGTTVKLYLQPGLHP